MCAAITGELDEKLVRALLASENPSTKTQEAVLACEIIAAAGSTDWFDELDELQYRNYYKEAKASWTLAVCHGKAAIKSLKKALKHDPGNSSAKYSILELGERGE